MLKGRNQRPRLQRTANKERIQVAASRTPVEPMEKPYSSSHFLPGKIHGIPVQFLLDTGCTTNLLSKRVFDQLSKAVRDSIKPCPAGHGSLADGSSLPFYGMLSVSIKIRTTLVTETLIVSRIDEDAILGMPFLNGHDCHMEFSPPGLTMDGKKLACTDRHGRLLAQQVQLLRQTTINAGDEMMVLCQLPSLPAKPVGMVEGGYQTVRLAASLNQVDEKRQFWVRCLNLGEHPVTTPAGAVIGCFCCVDDEQITNSSSGEPSIQLCSNQLPGGHLKSTDVTVPDHLKDMFDRTKENASLEQQHKIAQLLTTYQHVFSAGDDDMGHTTLVRHEIPTLPGTQPIRQSARRLGPEKEAEVERQVVDLKQRGLITPACGAWSSPVVLVRKKDGSWRFCIDYRKLNGVTIPDAYPLPRIDESLEALAGSQYFSTLDLISGYWQVPLSENAQEKSAFVTRSGLWKWRVLPFGLTSAPATFQRLMEHVLRGLHWKTLLLYLDDIIVIAPDFDTHLLRLREVFQRLDDAGLKLKPKKCDLLQKEVHYLGHVVSAAGIATDPGKVEAVNNWPTPHDLTALKAFLGTVGYYRQYIPNHAQVAKPLNRLTAQKTTWCWDSDCQSAFETLKSSLISAPILCYPDPSKPYILDTDASAESVGAVLSQIQSDGREGVIAYYSKSLSPPERNYCVTRKELLGVIKAVKHFRPYLYGQTFRLRTDHASLIWICKKTEPANQVARWLETLSEFSYTIEHRSGSRHGNADGLSRTLCLSDCKQCHNIQNKSGGPTKSEVQAALPPSADHLLWQQGKLEPQASAGHTLEDRIQLIGDKTRELVHHQAQLPGPVQQMYHAVKESKPLSDEELRTACWELKTLSNRYQTLSITTDGVLVVELPTPRSRQVAVCPTSWRHGVIWEQHKQAHAGMRRTLTNIQKHWYWPGMTADVRRAINDCEVCQMAKHGPAGKTSGRRRMHAGRPWQLVAIDLVGPMAKTASGNLWILVISDHFTRWADALPLPDATAVTVARTLEERVFCYLGIPEQLHSDQGGQFDGDLMKELCALWGIEKTRTTPYNPQANGVVERNNRTLGDALRAKLLGATQESWDSVLPHIMRSYRSTAHSSTDESPNFLTYGREIRMPEQLVYDFPDNLELPRHVYTQQLVENLTTAHNLLRQEQTLLRSQDSDEPLLYAEGDLVCLRNKRKKKGETQKLQSRYVGPYVIVQSYPNHTYKVERDGHVSIQSERRLKPFRACGARAGQAPVVREPPLQPEKQVDKSRSPATPTVLLPNLPPPRLVPPVEPPLVPQPPPEDLEQPPLELLSVPPSPTPTYVAPPTTSEHVESDRPARLRRPPRYLEHYICDHLAVCECGNCTDNWPPLTGTPATATYGPPRVTKPATPAALPKEQRNINTERPLM